MVMPRSVCVYCGSSKGLDDAFLDAACRLGRTLAENNVQLVYGGGSLGLMGATAEAALEAGGKVVGIIPKFLRDIEKQYEDITELHVTKNMHERKQLMFDRSDAFVSLPGGIGTLEETVEMLTWSQLGRHNKPIVLLNVHNYWTPLLNLLDHMVDQKFVKPDAAQLWTSVTEVDQVLPTIDATLTEYDLGPAPKPSDDRF